MKKVKVFLYTVLPASDRLLFVGKGTRLHSFVLLLRKNLKEVKIGAIVK